jgi:hypothetical protein
MLKRISAHSLLIIFLSLLSYSTNITAQNQIIADHTVVDKYDDIPQEYIDIIKTWLVDIPGESHSSGYRIGMNLLENIDSRFQVLTFSGSIPDTTSSELRFGGHGSVGEEDFYTNTTAIANIKNVMSTQYNAGNPIHVLGFGWCWDMTWLNAPGGTIDPVYNVHWAGSSVGGPQGNVRWGLDAEDQVLTGNSVCMDTYLDAVTEYNQYCLSNVYACKVIFTTGPVDGNSNNENGYQREIKHQYIRDFVQEDESRVLFDYADILCWSDEGEQNTGTWNENSYPQIHSNNMLDLDGTYAEDGDHIGERGAVRLAKAMWWMLARMAGWDPDDQCPDDPLKSEPGICGCGVADTDSDGDGIPDCNDNDTEFPWELFYPAIIKDNSN